MLGGDRGLYPRLSAIDNLRFLAVLDGAAAADLDARLYAVLELLGLDRRTARRRVETYSRGMKQRLHLASALLSTAPVILLDEPTIGLDPIEAYELRAVISTLHSSGRTVILTSHYATDVEYLCNRIVLIDRGVVCADQPTTEFMARSGYVASVEVVGQGHPPPSCADPVLTHSLESRDSSWRLTYQVPRWEPRTSEAVGRIMQRFESMSVEVRLRPATLDESFRAVLGGDADS